MTESLPASGSPEAGEMFPFDASAYDRCELCPRRCRVNRTAGMHGACASTSKLRIARAALHMWEEPPISGEAGSGAIFFSGCPLRCVYCQNYEISQQEFGKEVSIGRLAKIMLELQDQGALNINLVTALHYAPSVREAILLARREGLSIPIVCNTSGYERVETIAAMSDVIDIWLTDFKYVKTSLGVRLSYVRDYTKFARPALARMLESLRERGGRREREDGTMLQGIIVRHLVLPGCVQDSLAVLDEVWDICGNDVDLSVMNQYTPNAHCLESGTELARAITEQEYELVLDHADELGFERLWWQQGGTVSESFVPPFDTTGVDGPSIGEA